MDAKHKSKTLNTVEQTLNIVEQTSNEHYEIIDMSTLSLEYGVEHASNGIEQTPNEYYTDAIIPEHKSKTLTMQFTALEHQIMEMLAEGSNSPKKISTALGIPASTVTKFLARDDVRKYAQELIDARNTAIKAHLPTMLMGIIEAKLERIMEDPEASLADASKKDIVDIARVVNELIKTSDSVTTAQDTKMDAFSAIYTQINNIQLNK